ncbi:MAG: hypothetical protein KKC75_00900 [Nanoarchaeota archaeon]|nr:hypothetical protein [Nanoarchaeota archaeon]MBU1005673.1 hypothetical protein [Nanoarchaeota archaeon]MBU1946902.1 hypothetical protein [Nanoarchaeota archaeon]
MKVEDHLESFKEHKETIFDWALRVKGLKNSQRIVGLHASRGIIDLFSAYLHEKNKITIGAQINHRWFKSNKVKEKLPEFEEKDNLVSELVELEVLCEDLSYGAPKPVEKIERALKIFKRLEETIEGLRKKNGKI